MRDVVRGGSKVAGRSISTRGALLVTVAAMLLLGHAATAAATPTTPYFNGFEADTSGWTENGGTIARVPSGTAGIPAERGDFYAEVTENNGGPFTAWGQPSTDSATEFPENGYTTEVAVYLDMAAATVASPKHFQWNSAVNGIGGPNEEAFFEVETDPATDGQWQVQLSIVPPSGFESQPPVALTETDWYILQHHFYEGTDGLLYIDLAVLDADRNVLTAHTYGGYPQYVVATDIGGARYGWFYGDAEPDYDPIPIDSVRLYLGPPQLPIDGPIATDDFATVAQDDPPSAIDVLGNDLDPDGVGPVQIDSVVQPANGTVQITGGGSGLTYAPNAGYCNDPAAGPADDFTYTLNGGSEGKVTVTVTCADSDGDGITDNLDQFPNDGTETGDFDGDGVGDNADNCAADSNPGQADADSDGRGDACDSTPPIDPIAIDGSATVAQDDPPSAIDVLGNDLDPDGVGPKQIDSVVQPANGTVQITGGGSGLTYAPDAGYCNDPAAGPTDDFTYTLNGGSEGKVTVTVTCADSDGDGITDNLDQFPNDGTETGDFDGDGVGDQADNCAAVKNPGQADADSDGRGDACDPTPAPPAPPTPPTGSDEPEGSVPCPEGTSDSVICAPNEDGGLSFQGTAANETFVGSNEDDMIRADGGRDKIRGGAGDDRIAGGDARDELRGNAGEDNLAGNDGSDDLMGSGDDDRLRGGKGNDELKGQGGEDDLKGNGGRDEFSGGGSNDKIDSKGQRREKVSCGAGRRDRVKNARGDRVRRNCERVQRR